MSTTVSKPPFSAAALAHPRWPKWIGLKLPPRQSRRAPPEAKRPSVCTPVGPSGGSMAVWNVLALSASIRV